MVEVSEAVFHDHVLEDGVVGVEGHLGGDQASEVGGQAEEGEQREAEEVLASSQCEVWSGYCYHLCSMSEHLGVGLLSCENKINAFSSLLIGIAVSLTPSKGSSAPRSWIIINLLPELLSA